MQLDWKQVTLYDHIRQGRAEEQSEASKGSGHTHVLTTPAAYMES